ncbi:MAG: hypothetical protein ACOYBE_05795 [Blautia sp.]|jgi:hypothetical protein
MGNKGTASKAWRRMFLFFLLCAAGLMAALWLGHKKEEGSWKFLVLSAQGELTYEVQEQLAALPGLVSIGPVCAGEMEIKLDGLQKMVPVLGVELDKFPFHLSCSAGAVSYGNRLPLVLGNGSLDGFEDEYQTAATKRQKQLILSGQVQAITVEGETEGVLLGVNGTGKQPDSRIYGERTKVEALLEQQEKTLRQGVWLVISGRKNADTVRGALEQADFLECSEF